MSNSRDSILYGGVLKTRVPCSSTDSEVIAVAKFAANFARQRAPSMVSKLEDRRRAKDYKITDVQKHKILYTQDGVEQYEQKFVTVTESQSLVHARTVDFGFTYDLKLTWILNEGQSTHEFTVTQYPSTRQFHIFTHAYYMISDMDKDCQAINSETLIPAKRPNCASETMELPHDKYTSDLSKPEKHPECTSETTELPHDKYTSDRSTKLKLLSYNIWNLNGKNKKYYDYSKRIMQLGHIVSETDADIIAFQEVRFTHMQYPEYGVPPIASQIEHLYGMLKNYQFVYQPAMMLPNSVQNGRNEEGLAIFSKYPIINHGYILLYRNVSSENDNHQRICLHVEIHVPGYPRTIHVFDTHLSLNAPARKISAKEIADFMTDYEGPAFIMGDFNAEPNESSIKFLTGFHKIHNDPAGDLVDLWSPSYGPGFTFTPHNNELHKRIDYIFMKPSPLVTVTSAELLDDGRREETAASDHLGVIATIYLKRPDAK